MGAPHLNEVPTRSMPRQAAAGQLGDDATVASGHITLIASGKPLNPSQYSRRFASGKRNERIVPSHVRADYATLPANPCALEGFRPTR